MRNPKNNSGLLVAALTGVLIGATVAVLYAPESGKVTRMKIREDVERTSIKLNDAAMDVKGKVIESLERQGNGLGYMVGSVIARSSPIIKEIVKALEKELRELKSEISS